ncbi:DUF2752 domain-containing protein [Streptomyces sp. RKND-216]|nr:DUF2752 domain-containing protein [Streptomyces sp. RKND-216]
MAPTARTRQAGTVTHAPTPTPAGARTPGTLTRLAAPLSALAAVAGAFAYVAARDPNAPGHYPACPLLQLTGILCPGCGGLRSAHAVSHGDLAAALGANALALAGMALAVLFLLHWCVRVIRARPVTVPVRPVHLWLGTGLVLVFTVVRNLPFGAALAP